MVAITASKDGDLTFRRRCRSADGVIHGEPLASSQASRRACCLQQLHVSCCSALFQTDCRCLQGQERGIKAALLDGGHAEVKDDSILRALPAVTASHFSSHNDKEGNGLEHPSP